MSTQQTLLSILPSNLRKFFSFLKANILRRSQDVSPMHILDSAYKRLGILNYQTDEISGESFLLHTILPALISRQSPTIFDVGANIGGYTSKLLRIFPHATIHAFEPSPETYAKLIKNVSSVRVSFSAKGLSDVEEKATFFDYEGDSSSHASLHGDVFSVVHHSLTTRQFQVELTTLDNYCSQNNIDRIDFIKIDTEGNELSVLKGANRLISIGGLPLIQFEFNEMNVISRSFLRDFYQILPDYSFYRLMPNGLLPLGEYSTRNEIFVFQNILAVRPGNNLDDSLISFAVKPLKP